MESAYSISLAIVQQRYPHLEDLVHQGNLLVIPRSTMYTEQRREPTEQRREPEEVFVVGTSHMSRQSVDDVRRVIDAVQPENVVVELCKSRSAVMYADTLASNGGGNNMDGSGKASNVFGLR